MPKVPTRDRLLDAALRAFAANGVDGTPIVELEEAAGLAPGSGGFYRYFATKDDVLEAAVRREIDRVTEARGSLPRPDAISGDDPRALLRSEFERGLDTLTTIGPLVAILARERDRIPELAREIAERLLEGGARHDQGLVATVRAHDGAPATGGRPAENAGENAAVGAVLLSAIVGYHLATEYFGGPPAGVGRDDFVETLVGLVLPDRPG